ncbi:MAG: DEAD/DEAH box helicase family protein [Dehalococcoidia bacterium]|nr:DEAD/DEAH box helicase family protein [Dehalococcoidia bacterium]
MKVNSDGTAAFGVDMTDGDARELERVRRQLRELKAERDRLLAQNVGLLHDLKSLQESIHPIQTVSMSAASDPVDVAAKPAVAIPTVNDQSSLSQKIRLFRSLFRGREDVFAKLWRSRQGNKMGYSPACTREWNPTFCGKPRIRCGNCPNRDFSPVTDEVIQKHLEGKHTVGLYLLLPEETCHLLAVDFDKQSWMEDAAAFLETCRRMDVPAAIERSRSGNGAHVWIFFSQAVLASAARKLGCYLLTETMAHRHQVGMDSYDRLFPNQDTLPKGGFGNLIALPLQKGSVDKGNTVFLDGSFSPYRDQWAFLNSLSRMEASALDKVAREAVRSGHVIGVRMPSMDEEDQPWAIVPSRRPQESLLAGPFPARVRIVIGNLIYVEKEGLPSPLLNRIKRLAAFQNPEFYKKQSLRLSTALTPRVICCAEEFPMHLGIPRGCLDELEKLLGSVGIKPDVVDERFRGTDIEVTFHGQLTSAQETAVSDLIRHDNGILVAPSGSGKTVVGIYMIAARRTSTLVLVHRRPLLEQWRVQLASFLGVDPLTIGQIGGGKDRRSGLVDVAMIQSLIKKGAVENIVAEYGQVIVDECHHLPAVTFEQILRQVRARYVIGLTATPYRRDGHQPILLMQCGPVRHVIDQRDKRHQGLLYHHLICRDTGFTLPPQEDETSIHDIYAALVADETRNLLILNDLLQAVHNVIVLRGGMGVRQRRAVVEQMAAIPDGEERVLLATGRYIGEGSDDIRLDTLFLAMPISWKGTLVQYAGRLHRLHPGKVEVRIYDYVDSSSTMLLRMFQKRLRGYRAMGYEQDNPET